MFAENTEYEILTPDGWADFRGVMTTPNKKTRTIRLVSGKSVTATESHQFFINGAPVRLGDIIQGDVIDTVDSDGTVCALNDNDETDVFDVVEVSHPEHKFIVNSCIINKNCDELSYVRHSIAESMWASIAPTLATGGRCIITSTPSSDEGLFARMWFDAINTFDEFGNETALGRNGFKSYTCHWTDHPDRDQAWGDAMRATLGDEKFEREIECRFVGADETLIDSMKLSGMKGIEPIEKQGQVRWYKKPSKNKTYMIGLDPSLGTGSDPAAIQVFEMPGLTQVAEWSHNKTAIQKQVKIMQEICKYVADVTGSNNVYYSVENNTLGEAALVAISEIGEENFHGTFLSQPKKLGGTKGRKGFTVSHRSKLTACAKFKSLVERNKLTVNSKLLMSELKTFVSIGQSFEAKVGMHDDLVMATLLIITMLTAMQSYDSSLDSEMRDAEESYIMPMPFIMI